MAIVRTYHCDDCGTTFDKLHFDRADPAPECPGCQALASKQVPAGFSINGNASKAGDIAQNILEKDYGMTDIRDRQREGDISTITPPHLRAAVDGMWKPTGDIIAAAKAGAAAAKADGVNPLMLTQRVAKERGNAKPVCLPVNMRR